jgi:hypothetical protein
MDHGAGGIGVDLGERIFVHGIHRDDCSGLLGTSRWCVLSIQPFIDQSHRYARDNFFYQSG